MEDQSQEHRITAVEITQGIMCKDIDILKKDVKLIMENHLPHLKTDVESLKRMVKLVGSGIILAIIVNIVINLIS